LARALSEQAPGLRPPAIDRRANRVSFHVFVAQYDAEGFGGMSRDDVIAALSAEGIPCYAGYAHPLYRNPMFLKKDFWKGGFPCVAPFADPVDFADYAARCPGAERACREAVWFPQNLFLGAR